MAEGCLVEAHCLIRDSTGPLGDGWTLAAFLHGINANFAGNAGNAGNISGLEAKSLKIRPGGPLLLLYN